MTLGRRRGIEHHAGYLPIVNLITPKYSFDIAFGQTIRSNLVRTILRPEVGKTYLRYRLKTSISAILDKPDGAHASVKIPAGAVLHESSAHTTTLFGLVGVLWEGRHYSVALNDLLKNAYRIETA